jgi:hypothetical protein
LISLVVHATLRGGIDVVSTVSGPIIPRSYCRLPPTWSPAAAIPQCENPHITLCLMCCCGLQLIFHSSQFGQLWWSFHLITLSLASSHCMACCHACSWKSTFWFVKPFNPHVHNILVHPSTKSRVYKLQEERDIISFVLAAPLPHSCWLARMSPLFHHSSDHVLQPQRVSYPCTCLWEISWQQDSR